MGAELAVRSGAGTIVLDVRRGDGPPAAFGYTQPTLAASDRLLATDLESCAAAVRGIVKTLAALRADPDLATEAGRCAFPSQEAGLVAELVRRDLPFYDPVITPAFVASMNRFAQEVGVLQGDPPYEAVVATHLAPLWAMPTENADAGR